MRNLRAGAVVLTVLMSLGLSSAYAGPAPAAPPKLSKPVREALVASQKLAQEQKLAEALASAKQALALSTTAEEQFKSNEMLAFVHVQMRNNTGAADAFDALIASGLLPPDQQQQRMKNVCQLRYSSREFDKAITACTKFADQYNDRESRYLVTQVYYQQNNYPMVIQSGRAAITGDPSPPKAILQMLGRAYVGQKNMDGTQWTYEQIVDHYPEGRYWADLLAMVQQKNRTDARYELDVLRLRDAIGVAEIPGELLDLAEAAIKVGLPGEAKAVLERAQRGPAGTAAERTALQGSLASARTEAAADLRGMASAEAEARRSPRGEADLRTGEALISHGKVAEGLAAIQRGIGKGGIKDPTEARLRLGLALLAAGRRDEALVEIDKAIAGPGVYAHIARMWGIHLRNQIQGVVTEAAPEDEEEEEAEEEEEEGA